MVSISSMTLPSPSKSDEQNEDAFTFKELASGHLIAAVADGVSGSDEGGLAAKSAIRLVSSLNPSDCHGRALFAAFMEALRNDVQVSFATTRAQTTLTVMCLQPVDHDGNIKAIYFGIGDTGIVLAQDSRLDEHYPKTFICHRIFGRPQPSINSRLYSYVDLTARAVVGRVFYGEFDLRPGDICLIYSDGVRDDYILRTINKEHTLLWDVKENGPEIALKNFAERIQSDIGDDATVIAILADNKTVLGSPDSGIKSSPPIEPDGDYPNASEPKRSVNLKGRSKGPRGRKKH
jgi:serine/threonine protein phosphatase PrpC